MRSICQATKYPPGKMPSDGKYGFSVLVAGKELPEYHHPKDESKILVESMLWSPVTYWLDVREYCKFSDEVEQQKWPVTPFEIKVYAEAHCVQSWYDVYVDGVKVKTLVLDRGESRIVKGFPEGDGGYSEFLFSLPRFADDERDRVKKNRENQIGKIEVVRRSATFSHYEFHPANDESRECKFKQASKKDVHNITKLNYTMATTRRGRFIRDDKPYDRPDKTKRGKPAKLPCMVKRGIWDKGEKLGRLQVEYHMTHTLWDWNVKLRRPDWVTDMGTIVLDDAS